MWLLKSYLNGNPVDVETFYLEIIEKKRNKEDLIYLYEKLAFITNLDRVKIYIAYKYNYHDIIVFSRRKIDWEQFIIMKYHLNKHDKIKKEMHPKVEFIDSDLMKKYKIDTKRFEEEMEYYLNNVNKINNENFKYFQHNLDIQKFVNQSFASLEVLKNAEEELQRKCTVIYNILHEIQMIIIENTFCEYDIEYPFGLFIISTIIEGVVWTLPQPVYKVKQLSLNNIH